MDNISIHEFGYPFLFNEINEKFIEPQNPSPPLSNTKVPQGISNTTNKTEHYENLILYPNPLSNNELSVKTASNGSKYVEIYNMLGKKVYSKNITENKKIQLNHLGKGVYIVKVKENGKWATKKLIKN